MKHSLLSLSICSLFLLFTVNVLAQTDTDLLDLGRVQVHKKFTQHISIKGGDLEKFPAANLSEALNVWLYGTFSNKNTLVYVIDGNITTDVNVYSVYDIEEVTFIQNAMVQLNGVVQNAQMAYIKTRRNQPGKSGVTVAAQTNMVERRLLYPEDKQAEETNNDKTSDLSLFHRYYISAYKNTNRSKFGISAAYLKDVFPEPESEKIEVVKQPTLGRLNFNGYANAEIGKSSNLDIYLNYAPQRIKEEQNWNSNDADVVQNTKHKTGVINTGIKFKNKFSTAISNTLNFEYGNYNQDDYDGSRSVFSNSAYNYYSTSDKSLRQTANNFLLRDNFVYNKSFSGWTIEPSLNFSFRYRNWHKKDSLAQLSYSNGANTGYSYSWSAYKAYTRVYLLTPSINFHYKDLFNIQGGLVVNLSESGGTDIERRFPFISSSVDVVRLIDRNSKTGLRLFGSYAQTGSFADDLNLAANLDDDFHASDVYIPLVFDGSMLFPNDPDEKYKNIQAGADLILFDRVILSYSYNQREFSSAVLQYLYSPSYPSSPSFRYVPAKGEMKSHAIRLGGDILSNNKFKWNTSASITTVFNTVDNSEEFGIGYLFINNTYVGINQIQGKRVWSGGWANRLSLNSFTAEVDLLTKFRGTISNGGYSSGIYNSVMLQNLSVGYRIPSSRLQGLEVYLNSRNLIRNNKQNITDGRRYFGFGFKAAFTR